MNKTVLFFFLLFFAFPVFGQEESPLEPPSQLEITNSSFPVTFDWQDIEGAKSYLLRGRIDIPPGFWTAPADVVMVETNNDEITCPYGLWDETEGSCISLPSLESKYVDEDCFFTKRTDYKWQVASCKEANGLNCGNFSNEASLRTGNEYDISNPVLSLPENNSIVGMEDSLSWQSHSCSHYQKATITRLEDGEEKELITIGGINLNIDDLRNLIWAEGLNKTFEWNVQSCFVRGNIRCEPSSITETWQFKTGGEPPINLRSNSSSRGNIEIAWDKSAKTQSYSYIIAKDAEFNEVALEAKTNLLEAPITSVEPNTRYWWKVKSCADKEGDYCGDWSVEVGDFNIILNPPEELKKTSDFLPAAVEWKEENTGANFYQYKMAYAAKSPQETLDSCIEGQIIPSDPSQNPPITSSPNFTLNEICLGDYQIRVRSCLDKDCNIASDYSQVFNFTAKTQPGAEGAGLVPCGRSSFSDNPGTPYNEREPCQIKHIGFLLQNILDFLLWRLGLIVLGIYSIMSGAIAYFSLGGVNTLQRIKSIWKSAGIGYLILLLSWTLVNLVMSLAGFQAQFFGRWWQLPF